MHSIFRLQEYKALFYRIFLAYLFYFIARTLFVLYNYILLGEISFLDFFSFQYYGLTFDTTAILYVNLLFIVLSIFPVLINTRESYQKMLFYIYFVFNLIAYATNFVDFIYFKFILTRSTISALESIQNEGNKGLLFLNFLKNYWHVFLLYFVLAILWVLLYKRLKVSAIKIKEKKKYFTFSIIVFVILGVLIVGGIRGGDFKESTRPINMVDANRHVKNNIHANIVLNTPFSIIRTINKRSVKKIQLLPDEEVLKYVSPVKQYPKDSLNFTKPNIVVFIIESFGREYVGAFNKNTGIENYKGHTPFIDSLAQHSLIFDNAYANGYKSIHAMSSVLSGIPSFRDAFTSSPFSNQKIQSLVSVLNEEEGYHSSFFHGAENGSMGFLGYSNILGIDNYYGREEYNNDDDFDGVWGIWDEPFLQFMKEKLDEEKEPFFSTIMTVSSHEPFQIPDKYKEKFPEGDLVMHKCVRYTDYALQQFFEAAKKESWFQNTIFVMVADHANITYYNEYVKPLNIHTLPILFYSSNEHYKGLSSELAQQIDIYPTLLDMIGYDKPFRSWGRSLISDKEDPFVIRYMGSTYYYFYKDYVCLLDNKTLTGVYKTSDKSLQNNLIDTDLAIMPEIEYRCKAFIQNYMDRIIDYKLDSVEE